MHAQASSATVDAMQRIFRCYLTWAVYVNEGRAQCHAPQSPGPGSDHEERPSAAPWSGSGFSAGRYDARDGSRQPCADCRADDRGHRASDVRGQCEHWIQCQYRRPVCPPQPAQSTMGAEDDEEMMEVLDMDRWTRVTAMRLPYLSRDRRQRSSPRARPQRSRPRHALGGQADSITAAVALAKRCRT
jgi:hypothetical protein